MQPYRPPPRATPNPWIYIGPASSIPNITPTGENNTKLSSTEPSPSSSSTATLSCKILQLASPSSSAATLLTPDVAQTTLGIQPQILIFRYRDKIHAIDHSCPHQNFPLSQASLYDIEDFGMVLSAGIACPKHGWSFDVNTGQSDRGGYKLGVWEVEVRGGENGFGEVEEEVWVRRKEKSRIA
ncbi:hypothetical protein CERZMDRAFT_95411 [Cercospora zeae-maydis SCOH1-5]|uniref:Rieske domain-containing protein n=1 Tax=Cercospora zeae-maydis SCOH1-5 TaxID=717836 RepID=A0A6A6FNL4_9PEZI|nr:hypothetical protein CERZMDRAFT_95411 [Cercospora zeae-maydis SCOH1-5]